MKYLITFFRIIVGSVLVVSGLIKANDTLGFSYKLEEYFEPTALGMPFLMDYALIIAAIVCVAEVVLGLSLLFGTKYKLTVVLVFLMFVFFGFLTYYTASCDPHEMVTYINSDGISITEKAQCVLDCGCFGDALHLEPWQSFKKDMWLLGFTLPLFLGFFKSFEVKLNNERKDRIIFIGSILFTLLFSGGIFGWWMPASFIAISALIAVVFKFFYINKGREWALLGIATILTSAFVYYTLTFLPVKDFRAYAEGNNLPELMKTSDDFKEEISSVEYEKRMPLYSQIIEQEVKALVSNYPGLDTLSEEMKIEVTENIHQDVVSKYETIVYTIADSIAQDSLERGNLLPPVYASEYYLQNKETNERKYILSTEYMEKKLWKTWDYVYVLVNKETGDVVEIEKKDYKEEEWITKGYKKKSFRTIKIKDGREPKISPDFDFNDDKINQDVLHGDDYLLLVVTWDLDKSREKSFVKLNDLYAYSQEKGYKFYGATSTVVKAEAFKKRNKVAFDFASADEKILKTIVRSNPGVVLLKNGIVIKKWGQNTIPTSKKLEKTIKKWEEKK